MAYPDLDFDEVWCVLAVEPERQVALGTWQLVNESVVRCFPVDILIERGVPPPDIETEHRGLPVGSSGQPTSR